MSKRRWVTSVLATLLLSVLVGMVGTAQAAKNPKKVKGAAGTSDTAGVNEDKENKQKQEGTSDVVAKIGDQTLTLQEVDAKALAMTMEGDQQLYEARKGAVEELLIDLEAKARGMTRDQLIEQEVNQKVQPVTDEAIAAFYEQNKGRMGTQTLEQAKDRIRDYLTPQQNQLARQAFIDQLKKRSDVVILLEPPRADVTVADNDPSRGPAAAPIQIVEFSEFQ